MLLGILPQFFLNPGPPYFASEGLMPAFLLCFLLSLILAIPHYFRITVLSQGGRRFFCTVWILAIGSLIIFLFIFGMAAMEDSIQPFLLFIASVLFSLAISWLTIKALIAKVTSLDIEKSLFGLIYWHFSVFLILFMLILSLLFLTIDPLILAICLLLPVHVLLYICNHLNKISSRKLALIVIGTIAFMGLMIYFLDARTKEYRLYHGAWENRAKLTLRAIGSSQLAFYDVNNHFGTWEELYKQEYIQKDYSRANVIDQYSICLFDATKENTNLSSKDDVISSFTIIAIPRQPEKFKLRTFSLIEDQVPRIWVGNSEEFDLKSVSIHNPKHWQPLR